MSIITAASAQYFPPVPPEPIIIRKTTISVSFTEPQKVVTINVTRIDPGQIVKIMVLTFKEPVLTVNLIIYQLKEKPPEVPEPSPSTPLLYFTIVAHEKFLKNVEKAIITFSIEKGIVEEKKVDEKTITLNRFFEGKWEKLPTTKIVEDEKFLYFEAESPGLSHFAITGVILPSPFPWWIIVIIIVIIAVIIIIIVVTRLYKRSK
jgi:PGF-pre-PGF domain-containing protein